jgi:hypothetical protein
MQHFKAKLEIIGINPFVFLPETVLQELFKHARKTTSPIPVHGTINGTSYQQNLMKFKGEWRLYINTVMLKKSPKRIGESIEVTIAFDPSDRSLTPHPKLMSALNKTPEAQQKFESLSPSLQKEIIKYIASLKTEESVDRNVNRAIGFLLGKNSFIGRNKV